MKTVSNFPFFEIEFNKTAKVEKPEQVADLLDGVKNLAITDLVVISHGWNNDMKEAEYLYHRMIELLEVELNKRSLSGKKIGVLGIYWPSKKFAEKEFIPGGAAGIEEKDNTIATQLQNLTDFFDDESANEHLATIKKSIEQQINTGSANEEEFYAALTALFKPITENASKQPDEDAAAAFQKIGIDEILVRLEEDEIENIVAVDGAGGATSIGSLSFGNDNGGSAGLGSWLNGIKNGLFNVLNLATYYQMKERAGKVGQQALNPILQQVQEVSPNIKLHLIGHSFGARLVTAAIAGANPENALSIQSLILLQAAFSHYGFAKEYDGKQNGLFHSVIENKLVDGVMAVSHSKHDMAVGYAYPLASRVARQIASAFGGKDDPYGGLGRNGALKSGADDKISLILDSKYTFDAGKIYNLNADLSIAGHGDIDNSAVAQVIAEIIS